MKVAVFLPNWIGDVAMATPTLRALRGHFGPLATITGVQRPYVSDVLAGTNWLSDVIEFNPKAKRRRDRFGTLQLARELRARSYDTAIILPNSPRPALAAWLGKVPQRLGYSRYYRGPLLTEKLDPPRDGRALRPISALDYYLQLAEAIGADTTDRSIELGSTSERDAEVKRLWNDLGIQGKTVVTFNTGGAYGAAKSWPAEHFAGLANRIANGPEREVVVVCGPAERATAEQIVSLCGNRRVHSLAKHPTSIGFTKAVIKHSDMLVTTDSGPRFFGTAFGIPTVTLFGSTDPQWSQTGHPLELNLNIPVDCGPCAKRVCPLRHHRCMRDLTPEMVHARIEPLLVPRKSEAA